jgi:general secretion pathway protein H
VRGSRGFTLLELAVVLLVLGLAAAVVAPPMGRSLESIRLRAEVAGVASFLRAARERAITRRDALEVAIEADGHALVLRASDGAEGFRAVRRLAPSLRIEADPPRGPALTFLAYGASTGGRFRLAAPGPVVYLVTVEPLTGRVTTHRIES